MTEPSSRDLHRLTRTLDALVTQLSRIADGQRPDDGPTPDFTSPIAGRIEVRRPCPYCGDQQMIPRHQFAEHVARLHPDVRTGGPGIPMPAADEDAQRTTRRAVIGNLLARVGAGLTPDEDALLRRHVETEMRDADTARHRAEQAEDVLRIAHETSNRSEAERARAVQRAEQADAVTAETKRLLERRTKTLRERAERAEAATERVRAAVDALCHEPHPSHDHVCPDDVRKAVRAALDGTEQPTTED